MSVNNAMLYDISIIKKSKIKNYIFAVNNSVHGAVPGVNWLVGCSCYEVMK